MKAIVKEATQLIDFLCEIMQTSKKAPARNVLKFGAVQVDGEIIKKPNHELAPGQMVQILKQGVETKPQNEEKPSPFAIHYEDEAIILVHKPAGLLSIGTQHEKRETLHSLLFGYMQSKNGGRVYSVHRLDRFVSGLMVFAKTSEAKTNLQLNWHEASKRYVALVSGIPPEREGRIETWLKEVSTQRVEVCEESEDAKHSITEYKFLRKIHGNALLDINLLSGRRHQIRVHLAHLGYPILGDRVYGKGKAKYPEILLSSYFLRFRHPITGKMQSFEIPKPRWEQHFQKKRK